MSNLTKFPLPPQAGAGFKPEHTRDILADHDPVAFFEVHAENYMGKGGAPHATLSAIRSRFPVFVHGVGLSIGSPRPLDQLHLARLEAVVNRYEPSIVSEHLAWSTHDTHYLNDLLPVPYTQEVLARVVEHVDQVQNALKRQILVENPSTYVAFEQSTMPELSFITEMQRRTGCGLLLDINNVFVSSTNHSFTPASYLDQFPLQHVQEIHLAGHATDVDGDGKTLLIDAHDRPVASQVWELYEDVIARIGPLPTLIEWDNDVPAWQVLKHEAQLANAILARHSEGLKRAS